MNLFPELTAAGGGLGAGLGSLLGQVGDVLSAPRRALWSLVGAGDKSGADVVGELTGESDSPLSHILGFGLEALTDPLTYAGGLLGGLGGRAANKGLTRAAEAAGPGYAADVGKLSQGFGAVDGGMRNSTLGYMLEQEPGALGRVASELPEGSKLLGAGGEGVAYVTPQGNVVRVGAGIGPGGGKWTAPPDARTVAPEILQPARNVTTGNLRVEHLPRVDNPDSAYQSVLSQFGAGKNLRGLSKPPPGLDEALAGVDATWGAGEKALTDSALARGLQTVDSNVAQNVGRTAEGKWLTYDPGLFEAAPGKNFPLAPEVALAPEQGGMSSWLARLLGGQRRLRGALETPFSTRGQGI